MVGRGETWGSRCVWRPLRTFIETLIEQDNLPRLREILDFIEELAADPDERIRDVVRVSVLEPLSGKRALIEKARDHLGTNTLTILREIEGWKP